ncbi:MAG: hypothetical protein JHC30_06155 [Caldisericum sp.]|nr:hypothetical protein [Caldisericum sp.]
MTLLGKIFLTILLVCFLGMIEAMFISALPDFRDADIFSIVFGVCFDIFITVLIIGGIVSVWLAGGAK